MKLRNKVLISTTLVWSLFLIAIYFGANIFLLNGFLQLEADRANQDLARVDQALGQMIYTLTTFTSDWSHWNALYDYVQGKNPSFARNNLTMTAFLNSTINVLTYWNKNHTLIVGAAVDTDKGKMTDYPAGLNKYVNSKSPLLNLKQANDQMSGLILLPEGIMMVSSAAITDGNKLLPPLGTMVTGRYISPKIIQKIEDTTQLRLKLLLPTEISFSDPLTKTYETIIKNSTGHLSNPINKHYLNGYSILRDINKQPIGMFQITLRRGIYQNGVKAINYFITSIITIGIILSLIILALLRTLIIKRLEKLDNYIFTLSAENELTSRVDASGTDEISSLSAQFNHMMDIIQISQEKLETRVQERTQELEQEIIERKTAEKELTKHKEYLARLAHYDVLTSLPNRVFFNEMLNKSLKAARANNNKLAIIFIDLDRFKTINDALGHHIGDLVLKEIGKRITQLLRPADVIARLGGDEFIIMIDNVPSKKYINDFAEAMLKVCAKPIIVATHEFYITASIGICIFPDDGDSLEDLQRNADMAMYKSKHAGGGVFKYFSKEMNIEVHEYVQLEAMLRKAIKNNEFKVFYQPQLELSSGKIMGVEALIRWEHPELGMINPSKFIPVAEETGLIMEIGAWVMREACKANKSWQELGLQPIVVAVNISPKQFRHQDITQLISAVMNETQLAPEYLEIEITESAVMDNIDNATKKLQEIKSMNVKIAIDDFATGYTSISYLKKFPVSVLKIDQSFVKGIPANPNDVAITEAVIALAHSMGMKVIAEGVESSEQLLWLADKNCDIVQGYFLSRPLQEQKLVTELASTRQETQKILS